MTYGFLSKLNKHWKQIDLLNIDIFLLQENAVKNKKKKEKKAKKSKKEKKEKKKVKKEKKRTTQDGSASDSSEVGPTMSSLFNSNPFP